MSGEPTRPKSAGDVSSTQKPGKAGSLPEQTPSATEDIAAFVAKARAMSPQAAGARGRLVFALDATMSRQPTWDMACALQADMFRETAALGSLDIRLVYYRGLIIMGVNGRGPLHHGNDPGGGRHPHLSGSCGRGSSDCCCQNNLVKGIYAYSLAD